jgi:putative heme-binding domain-containing protein
LAGDADRGRRLFHESTVVQCRTCHRVGGSGVAVGPELDGIGLKYDQAALLQHIVKPSLRIDPEYVAWTVETVAGTVLTGLLVERTDEAVVLRDIQDRRHRIVATEIEEIRPLQTSLMPEMLLRDFTPQQAADLLEYLGTLRVAAAP